MINYNARILHRFCNSRILMPAKAPTDSANAPLKGHAEFRIGELTFLLAILFLLFFAETRA
jgi:hypothetical protein